MHVFGNDLLIEPRNFAIPSPLADGLGQWDVDVETDNELQPEGGRFVPSWVGARQAWHLLRPDISSHRVLFSLFPLSATGYGGLRVRFCSSILGQQQTFILQGHRLRVSQSCYELVDPFIPGMNKLFIQNFVQRKDHTIRKYAAAYLLR